MNYTYESNVVYIKDMTLSAIVGINAKERSRKTKMILNVTIWINDMRAKDTDDIRDTLNYSEIYEKIREIETATSYQLIETLADHVMQICFEQPLAKKVTLTIEKPHIHKGSRSAGIEVTAIAHEPSSRRMTATT